MVGSEYIAERRTETLARTKAGSSLDAGRIPACYKQALGMTVPSMGTSTGFGEAMEKIIRDGPVPPNKTERVRSEREEANSQPQRKKPQTFKQREGLRYKNDGAAESKADPCLRQAGFATSASADRLGMIAKDAVTSTRRRWTIR